MASRSWVLDDVMGDTYADDDEDDENNMMKMMILSGEFDDDDDDDDDDDECDIEDNDFQKLIMLKNEHIKSQQ
eukprot:4257930-Amphidinium_carterae.1